MNEYAIRDRKRDWECKRKRERRERNKERKWFRERENIKTEGWIEGKRKQTSAAHVSSTSYTWSSVSQRTHRAPWRSGRRTWPDRNHQDDEFRGKDTETNRKMKKWRNGGKNEQFQRSQIDRRQKIRTIFANGGSGDSKLLLHRRHVKTQDPTKTTKQRGMFSNKDTEINKN